MRRLCRVCVGAGALLLLAGVSRAQAPSQEFFDDFSYQTSLDPELADFGWYVRTGGGGPGPRGVSWAAENVTFLPDPDDPSNQLMQLAASTKGTGRTTSQAEVNSPTKFMEGTFAARVWLTDAPAVGPDGDEIVETFFTIAPYELARKPEYSEMDFEYLANGGWGATGPALFNTTWETASMNISSRRDGSLAGSWHIWLVVATGGTTVDYYQDGALVASHSGVYYPDGWQAICFNLWYINRGFVRSSVSRSYVERVDWVYAAPNVALTTAQVAQIVAGYRAQGVPRLDTVPLP